MEPIALEPLYPVRLYGRLDEPLSRWLWWVKWLLLVPHLVMLLFLWIAFVLLTVVAWVAVLVTARYPVWIFKFNVGVLRWSWRVGYYGYGALGTDRYPPFTLAEVPDYPAVLEVDYPPRLSRGLALVKWWLLALPHYLVLGVLFGGPGGVRRWDDGSTFYQPGGWGLVGLLVLFAAVLLLFTGRYPGGLFDLVLGLNRWAWRVIGYVTLLTDRYPPMRLDQGGPEPGGARRESTEAGRTDTG